MNIMVSEITGSLTFVQLFVQAFNKETSKIHVTGPLWGESTGDQWIPLTMARNIEMFA